VVGALMLMAVVLASGRPTVFTDTDDYYAQGRGAARALKPIVSQILHIPRNLDEEDAELEAEADEDHTSMAARSPYYGILLYGAFEIGTLWLLAAIQSLVAAWTLFTLIRGVMPQPRPRVYLSVMGGLSLLSTLPFFAGFGMPDVFAPLGALATTALAIYWTRYSRLEIAGLIGVITASLWFHTSHILLELVLIGLSAAILWWFRSGVRTLALRAGVLFMIVVSAFASDMAYHAVVKARTGEDLHRPPFLSARVLADGPGRVYLREACAKASPYVLCHFKTNPLDDSDEILWADDPARGIFNASKIDVRIALEQEEKAFVLQTILHHPLEQLGASLTNWFEQMSLVDLSEPLRDPGYYFTNVYWRDTSLPTLIPGGHDCLKHPRLCRPWISISWISYLHGTAILLGTAFLGWRTTRRDVRAAILARRPLRPGSREALVAAVALLVLAVIVNSAVTGILSGPFARYHARMVWILPAAAAVTAWRIGPGFDVRAAWAYWSQRLRRRSARQARG
jgi:hypothetical protein